MGPFEMVVAIVFITMVGGVAREYMKRKEVRTDELDDIQERLSRLESLVDRVQALETIVTDGKEDLKRKIDSL